jgi:hypothetical protein
MQTVPDTTASGAHFLSGLAPCAPAVLASNASAVANTIVRDTCLMTASDMTVFLHCWVEIVQRPAIERRNSGQAKRSTEPTALHSTSPPPIVLRSVMQEINDNRIRNARDDST